MQTLYRIDSKGKLRTWEIYSDAYTIYIHHGLINGKKIEQVENIVQGKASRTIDEQIESRINSRINNQLAKGYKRSIQEANTNVNKNEINMFKPMLAQQFNKQKGISTDGAVLQRKLDGNRMLVTRNDGNILAYTRNGKPIKTLEHILEQMDWLNEGQTVDGEVYKHGMALKDIRGGVAKKQTSTLDLDYHIYDVIEDRPFIVRFNTITSYTQEEALNSPNVVIEPYWYYSCTANTEKLFKTVRKQGYEGLMMRLDGQGYESGKRSKNLLKIKYRYDAEYSVIDINKDKNGLAVLTMQLPNGKTVKGVAPGTQIEKRYVAEHPYEFTYKNVTCSFAYLTDYGIPFHLVCEGWR